MAKDKITEYDATANNNTVCGDVNIAENSALPSDMNNFAREIMSHLKEGLGSGTPLYVDQTNNRVGINKTPTVALDVSGDADLSGTLDVTGTVTAGGLTVDGVTTLGGTGDNYPLIITSTDTYAGIQFQDGVTTNPVRIFNSTNNLALETTDKIRLLVSSNGDISFREDTGTTAKLFWDASEERLGIGTASPSVPLNIVNSTSSSIRANQTNNGTDVRMVADATGAHIGSYAGTSLFLKANSDTKLTITTNGDVGIGTTSPATYGTTNLEVNGKTGGSYVVVKGDNDSIIGELASDGAIYLSSKTAHPIKFRTTDTERMRITSAGRVSIGTTTETAKVSVYQAGNSLNLMRLQNTDGGNSCTMIQFSNSASASCGLISQTGATTVSYTTSSDYRLKENVSYSFDATTRLKTLKPCRFNFIQDGTDKVVDGFLAHEVQEIVPEAIIGTKDAVDADGNPVYQGIDQSKLVPLLVKTIQELEARITALENGE